jgi:hypothetical protein
MLRNGISNVVTKPQIKHFTTNVIAGVRTRTRALKLRKTAIHSLRTPDIIQQFYDLQYRRRVAQGTRPLQGLSSAPGTSGR